MHQTDKTEMYRDQDDCLVAIADGKMPLSVTALNKLPPYRAFLMARLAKRAGVPLEMGTIEQLQTEADKVGGNGKLGRWWEGEVKEATRVYPDLVLYNVRQNSSMMCVSSGTPAEVKLYLERLDDYELVCVCMGDSGVLVSVENYMKTFQ